jgi:REP element-mobilizing transposase RayT
MLSRLISTSRTIGLPHWQSEEGTYFVTFRLIDSLPDALARLRGVRRIEEALDRGYGAAHLAVPEIGDMVFETLRFFHGKRYTLHSACVMPNHVHSVLRPAASVCLSDILHSWKGFTANRANKILGRTGPFWQRESYDRLIRDENEFRRANAYVLANPEKARLREWKWVGLFDTTFLVKYEER